MVLSTGGTTISTLCFLLRFASLTRHLLFVSFFFHFFVPISSLLFSVFFLETCDEMGRELLGIRRRMEGASLGRFEMQ